MYAPDALTGQGPLQNLLSPHVWPAVQSASFSQALPLGVPVLEQPHCVPFKKKAVVPGYAAAQRCMHSRAVAE